MISHLLTANHLLTVTLLYSHTALSQVSEEKREKLCADLTTSLNDYECVHMICLVFCWEPYQEVQNFLVMFTWHHFGLFLLIFYSSSWTTKCSHFCFKFSIMVRENSFTALKNILKRSFSKSCKCFFKLKKGYHFRDPMFFYSRNLVI